MAVRLFYVGVLASLGGVGLRTLQAVPIELTLVGLVVALALALLWRRLLLRSEPGLRDGVLVISVGCCLLCLGVLRVEWAEQQSQPAWLETAVGSPVVLEGVIAREPDVRARCATSLYRSG